MALAIPRKPVDPQKLALWRERYEAQTGIAVSAQALAFLAAPKVGSLARLFTDEATQREDALEECE